MILYRRLVVLSAVISWILISFGAFVRLKGAGLSCPDWPLCYGQLIPPPGFEIALEVGHRFLATILGIIIIALVFIAPKNIPHSRRLSLYALALVIFQGILGGLTVLWSLNPLTVIAHLIFGNALLMLLIYMALSAYIPVSPGNTSKPVIPGERNRTYVILAVFLLMMLSGGLNSSTYSGYSCPAFPLCYPESPYSFSADIHSAEKDTDKIVPDNAHSVIEEYGRNAYIHMTHRITVIIGGIILLIYALLLHRKTAGTYLSFVPFTLSLLILLETAIGILNAVYLVPVPISALHTAIASLIASLLTVILFFTNRNLSFTGSSYG